MAEQRNDRFTERDGGFTLIELLLVVLIAGVLATVVVFAVGGTRARADLSACGVERQTLETAVEVYFVEHGTTALVPTGTGHDRYEQTLVDARVITSVSDMFDVDASGVLVPGANSSC